MPKSSEWVEGWKVAEKEFDAEEHPKYENPFPPDSEAWKGYEEAVYTFTQK